MGIRGPKKGQKFENVARRRISDNVFDQAIRLPLKGEDLANSFGVSLDTLDRYCIDRFQKTFAEVRKENMGIFKRSIVGKQWELAMKGNDRMLKWLGQNYVEQAEKIEQKQSINIEPNVEYKTKWGGTVEPTDRLESQDDSDE